MALLAWRGGKGVGGGRSELHCIGVVLWRLVVLGWRGVLFRVWT